jgi:hypothetical protein
MSWDQPRHPRTQKEFRLTLNHMLLVVTVLVAPRPICTLLSAVVFGKCDVEPGMFFAIALVPAGFIVIPVVVVLAIVHSQANTLRLSACFCRHRCDE